MDINEYINKIKDLGYNKTYTVTTFGCQMNAKDSEKLEGMLDSMGYTDVHDEEIADIVIYNTCTVRENANDRLYGHIGQLKNSYLKNKHKIIGICGCMMQEKDEVENILKKFPYVKIIFGTYNLSELPKLIYDVLDQNKKQISVYDRPQGIVENLPTINKYNFKCGINISYGCNNYCTYCIVPYVRGPERSREKDDIIREIKENISKGVKEIMLLGQNVNSYGNDNKACSFPELLSEVAHIDGLKRIRFMTSHPKDLSKELVQVIKENQNICRHIHLPVQSGSDRILSLMNRKYTREHYIEVVDYIKKEIPDISLTTDVIVGFPTET
ncbi:MAG: tRNA (N6-isopentenyl adenosine(37)-C2)-methylthiotransferase MiaB, partial [Lachnospiraceae bacterium]|nr:tRNA (N6-isopentenyl adenosine(37)-C2)-methylthiotransferase MiaB [Lachnospiraceae bacterium]